MPVCGQAAVWPPPHNNRMNIDGLEVQVARKPIKNMYIRIKPPNGDVVISAPRRMADRTIVDFVRGRRAWIDEHRRRMIQARNRAIANMGETAAGVDSGKAMETDGGARDGSSARFATVGSTTIGHASTGPTTTGSASTNPTSTDFPTRAEGTAIWTDERKRAATASINAQLPALLAKWGPIIGRTPSHITLRLMTSRWGSCTPATGRIRLNLQLGLMEPRFLEYVLVHEMTHLWERGHGVGFQRRMTAYLPQWKALRRELNRRVVL